LAEKNQLINKKDKQLKQMNKDILYQDEIISEVQEQLNQINTNTFSFKQDIESGENLNLNQADKILNKISVLNQYLDEKQNELDQVHNKYKGLISIISQYKKDLDLKEKEIKNLKIVIKNQNISLQKKTERIEVLEVETKSYAKEIEALNNEIKKIRADAYYDLAVDLESLFDEIPRLKKGLFGGKKQRIMDASRVRLKNSALEYYKKAQNNGHNDAIRKHNLLSIK